MHQHQRMHKQLQRTRGATPAPRSTNTPTPGTTADTRIDTAVAHGLQRVEERQYFVNACALLLSRILIKLGWVREEDCVHLLTPSGHSSAVTQVWVGLQLEEHLLFDGWHRRAARKLHQIHDQLVMDSAHSLRAVIISLTRPGWRRIEFKLGVSKRRSRSAAATPLLRHDRLLPLQAEQVRFEAMVQLSRLADACIDRLLMVHRPADTEDQLQVDTYTAGRPFVEDIDAHTSDTCLLVTQPVAGLEYLQVDITIREQDLTQERRRDGPAAPVAAPMTDVPAAAAPVQVPPAAAAAIPSSTWPSWAAALEPVQPLVPRSSVHVHAPVTRSKARQNHIAAVMTDPQEVRAAASARLLCHLLSGCVDGTAGHAGTGVRKPEFTLESWVLAEIDKDPLHVFHAEETRLNLTRERANELFYGLVQMGILRATNLRTREDSPIFFAAQHQQDRARVNPSVRAKNSN